MSTIRLSGPLKGKATILAILLTTTACHGASEHIEPSAPPPAPASTSVSEPPHFASAWWYAFQDDTLTALIEQGLAYNAEVNCQLGKLHMYDADKEAASKRLGNKIAGLFGDKSFLPDATYRQARVERLATRRIRLSRQIAQSYIEVRRLQQAIAIRDALQAQYKDNAEVAQFRREAGLTSALDGSLGASQGEAALAELGFMQGRLQDSLSELARWVGMKPEDLRAQLGSGGSFPEAQVDALSLTSPDDPQRNALTESIIRDTRLSKSLKDTERTVKDARLAYRQGFAPYSTLYVAEAAAASVKLALIDAKAARTQASLAILAQQHPEWAQADLTSGTVPMPSSFSTDAITVTAACD